MGKFALLSDSGRRHHSGYQYVFNFEDRLSETNVRDALCMVGAWMEKSGSNCSNKQNKEMITIFHTLNFHRPLWTSFVKQAKTVL